MEPNAPKQKRILRLDIRVTEEENRLIVERAGSSGVSAYVRSAALGQPIGTTLSAEERSALVGLGRNLNQAMKLAHITQDMTQTLAGLVDELKKILRA